MVCKHDEVVDAAGADKESAHVVDVELDDGIYPNMEFFGFGGGVRWRWRCCFGSRCGLGGSDALSQLFYVTLEVFYGDRAVLGGVSTGEAWTGGVVAWIDGCHPSWFDWET